MNNSSKMRYAKMQAVIITLLLLGAGCIGNERTDYNLKYDFSTGDRFIYNITHSTEKPMNSVPIHVDILVTDYDENSITTYMTLIKATSENTTISSYNTTMDIYGNLMKTYPEIEIIPEIQPELPNLLAYPKKSIQKGDSWKTMFSRTTNDTSSGIFYDVVGTKNCTCVGLKSVSIEAGIFKCVGIKSDVNFTSNMKTDTNNTTACIVTRGKMTGVDWVDLNSGFLVKSEYDIDTVTTTDLSEMYKELGFENFSREIPVTSHVSSYLEKMNKR